MKLCFLFMLFPPMFWCCWFGNSDGMEVCHVNSRVLFLGDLA